MNKTRLTKLPTNTEVTPDPAKEKEEKEKSEKAKESKNFTKKLQKRSLFYSLYLSQPKLSLNGIVVKFSEK